MKLGYFTLTDNPPGYGDERQDPNQLIQDTLDQCVYAEELGFHSVWVPEHHFSLFGVLPFPSAFLCHVAARTERVKLAPGTVVLPLNHPVKIAEEFALLDVLSNGRAVLSAGRGYDLREYEAFGADFTVSQELFFEGMDIVKKGMDPRGLLSRRQALPDPRDFHHTPPRPAALPAHLRRLL